MNLPPFLLLLQALVYVFLMYRVTSYYARLKSIHPSRNFSNGARSLRLYRMGAVEGNNNNNNPHVVTSHSLKSASSGRIARSLFLSTSAFFGPSLSKVLASTLTDDLESRTTVTEISKPTTTTTTISPPASKMTEIKKRGNDKRDYSTFTLPNGIRVLIVSDKQSVNAAAALDVHVGSFSDPSDVPGLAHFCEHMVRILLLYCYYEHFFISTSFIYI